MTSDIYMWHLHWTHEDPGQNHKAKSNRDKQNISKHWKPIGHQNVSHSKTASWLCDYLKRLGIRAAQSPALSDSNTKNLAENMDCIDTTHIWKKKTPWTWKPPRTVRGWHRLGIRTIISISTTSAETTQGHRTDEENQLLKGSNSRHVSGKSGTPTATIQ